MAAFDESFMSHQRKKDKKNRDISQANFPLNLVVHHGYLSTARLMRILRYLLAVHCQSAQLSGRRDSVCPAQRGEQAGGSPCRRRALPCTVATRLQRRSLAGPGIVGVVATRCRLPSLVAITSPPRPFLSLPLSPSPSPASSSFSAALSPLSYRLGLPLLFIGV